MSSSTQILCFSKDLLLLRTRQAILARHYAVTAVSTLEELVALPLGLSFDVAIFCHTLDKEECCSAAEIFRRRWPAGSVIALTANDAPCAQMNPDDVLAGIAGPHALLESIRSVLTRAKPRPFDGQLNLERPPLQTEHAHL